MKILVILLACFINYTNIIDSKIPQSQVNNNAFVVKSGLIKYKVQGTKTGSITVIFNNYGDSVYIESSMLLPDNTTIKSKKILIGNYLINLIPDKKLARISKVDNLNLLNSKAFITTEILSSLGYNKVSHEKFKGLDCDKYISENGEFFIWNNIIIKSEIKILNTISKQEVVNIQINNPNKSELFKIPIDYKIIKN